jgi:hypothetical protein
MLELSRCSILVMLSNDAQQIVIDTLWAACSLEYEAIAAAVAAIYAAQDAKQQC